MLLWRDADPVVRDRELDKARADEPCFAAYRTARSEFHGIRYQVDQHLHDLAAIGPESGQARLHIRLEVEVLTAVQRCCSVACLRRTGERRGGKECVSTGRSRWSPWY